MAKNNLDNWLMCAIENYEKQQRLYELEIDQNPNFNSHEQLQSLNIEVTGEKDVGWINRQMSAVKTNNNHKTKKGSHKKYFNSKSFQPVWLGKDINKNYLKTFNDGQNLYWYNDGVYKPKGESIFKKIATQLLEDEFRSDRVKQSLEWIKHNNLNTDPKEINPDDGLINLKNGLLDWKKGVLFPHNSERISIIKLPVVYKPNADDESIMKFIKTVIPDDMVDTIFEIVGYCLVTHTKYEKAFMLIGTGGNGKSTFINMITALLGQNNISNISIQDLEKNRFKLAELQSKLVNSFADLPRTGLSTASIFKSIVSGDSVNAERKNKDPFDFRPYTKLIFSANEIPRSADLTDGYFRRWIIVPFNKSFKPGTADPKLIEKLTTTEALSTLLNHAIEGLKRLERNGRFTDSETSRNALDTYKKETNNVVLFVDECCELDGEQSAKTTELYEFYVQWCKISGLKSFGKLNFNKRIALEYNLTKFRKKGESSERWKGIGLKD